MRLRLLIPLATVTLAACSGAGSPPPRPVGPATPSGAPQPAPEATRPAPGYEAATTRAASTITAGEIRAHIAFLASDELAGRDTPSPGLETAARYLADQMAAAGVEPAGDDGSYIQRFPYTRTAMVVGQRTVAFTGPSGATELSFGIDYYVIPGQQTAREAEVVFGGHAAAPTSGLAAVVREKVVLFATTGNPVAGTGEDLLNAFQAAAQGGASAMVLLLDDSNVADSILELASGIQGAGLATPLPVLGLSSARAAELFAAAGLDLAALRESPPAQPLTLDGIAMTVAAPFEVSQHTPPNVVGIVRGSDPVLRDQYIVYSAHFDHVGIGLPDESGDSIYNGADDDASGTSVLLETAAAFAALDVAPARSVIFLAVSGEEKGLLGSKYFSENPTVPIEGIIMNINMDMVGRNHPDTVVGVGRQYTNLGALADRIVEEHPDLGFIVIEDPKPEEKAFFRSDHLHFVNKDIPAIFFTSWDHEDYHKPSDEVELIDADKAARLARLVFYLGARVAGGAEDPAWAEGGLEEVRRLIAENGN